MPNLIDRAGCLLGRHNRSRSRAWDDGMNMRSYCKGCEAPMIRSLEGWRLYVSSDAHVRRNPHPNQR